MAVQLSSGSQQVFIGTRKGIAIRFDENDVRTMGRTAYGVRGISLRNDDEVVVMEVVDEIGDIMTVTSGGYGKRTPLSEYRVQYRGGYGIINIQSSERNGDVIGVTQVHDDNQVMVITQQGKVIRMAVAPLRRIGRNTQGVRMIRLDDGDRVESLARLDLGDVDVAVVQASDDAVLDTALEPVEETPDE
jgi:DNA gyrase subunit A